MSTPTKNPLPASDFRPEVRVGRPPKRIANTSAEAHPADVVQLWDHQLLGANWLLDAPEKGALLAWEPGTGKTFTALHAWSFLSGPCLYLCPAAIRWQVAEEARRLFPNKIVDVIKTSKGWPRQDADIIVCSYELARTKPLHMRLWKRQWGAIILDEAHALKNRNARRTFAVYGARTTSPGALVRRAERVWALTGTPVTRDPSDLWTHYSRLFPGAETSEVTGLPLTYNEWVEQYCALKHDGFALKIVGGRNLDRLAEILKPHMHRLRKEDVLKNLPPLLIDHVPVDPADIPRGDLPEEVQNALVRLMGAEKAGVSEDEFLNLMRELEPAMVTLRKFWAMCKAGPVFEHVRAHLEAAGPDSKVLVFSRHPTALSLVASGLEHAGFDAGLVHGTTTPMIRDGAVKAFQTGAMRVLCIQSDVGGTGLNLQAADRVVFVDAAWTPHANEQAIARAHRAGQTRPVHVSFFSLVGSIDEQVTRTLVRRARLIAKVLGDD